MRRRHSGRSSSSCTTHTCDAATPVSRIAAFTASPDRFMYVCGSTNHTPCDSERPISDFHRFRSTLTSKREASVRTHANPRLCLVSAYSASGLPSPTTRISRLCSMQTQLARGERHRLVSESTRRELHTRECKCRQGKTRHLPALRRGRVVPAQQVQQAMHAQQRELGVALVTVLTRLPDDSRPGDGHVTQVLPLASERQHVGGVVLAGELSVEPLQLGVIGQT